MNIEQYLKSYTLYREGVSNMKKAVEGFEKSQKAFEKTKKAQLLSSEKIKLPNYERLLKEINKKERILTYATARLECAIAHMNDENLSNYIICKYFYGMKNCEIADVFCYCERHIYRLSIMAKKRLYEELVKLMPKPKRWKGKTYFLCKESRQRNFTVS